MLQLDLSVFPVLRTASLVLREPVVDDAPALFALRSDPEMMRYIGKRRATTIDDALALLDNIRISRENHEGLTWAITLKGDDTLIGTVGFYRTQLEHHRGEVGYMLAPKLWGKGIMSEALRAAVDHGFNVLHFHSIEAVTDPENVRSEKVLERQGFKREGLFRENYHFEGKFFDSAVYSLLASDHAMLNG